VLNNYNIEDIFNDVMPAASGDDDMLRFLYDVVDEWNVLIERVLTRKRALQSTNQTLAGPRGDTGVFIMCTPFACFTKLVHICLFVLFVYGSLYYFIPTYSRHVTVLKQLIGNLHACAL